jgi:hypothetical protein
MALAFLAGRQTGPIVAAVAAVAGMPRQDALQGAVLAQGDVGIGIGAFAYPPSAYAFPAGTEESFRGERHFPSDYSDPLFRLAVYEGVLQ